MGHTHSIPHTNEQRASCSAKQQRLSDYATPAIVTKWSNCHHSEIRPNRSFLYQNSEKSLSQVACSRPGPPTRSNRFSLEISSFLRETLLLKGRSNPRFFIQFYSSRQLPFNPSLVQTVIGRRMPAYPVVIIAFWECLLLFDKLLSYYVTC